MNTKIKTELKAFQKFKKNFLFEQKKIEEIEGNFYCEGLPLYDTEKRLIGECEKWINISFHNKDSLSKILSNLYPYQFEFRGFILQSLESFFQGAKFKDKNVQKLVFAYSGVQAYHLKAASDYRWQETGLLYWQGSPFRRDSTEYTDIVDELYISAAQNPLYRQALKNAADRPLIHSIGETDQNKTVLTRFEYEAEINALAAFLKTFDSCK